MALLAVQSECLSYGVNLWTARPMTYILQFQGVFELLFVILDADVHRRGLYFTWANGQN